MTRQDAVRRRREEDRVRLAILVVLTIVTPILGFSFTFRGVREQDQAEERLRQLECSVRTLRAAVDVENFRQQTVRRVVGIINRYNPELPEETKLDVARTIFDMSLRYSNLSVDLICATITQESLWRPEAVSHAGAMGLMQIMPLTGCILAQAEGLDWSRPEEFLFDPIISVRLGCRYLSALIELYGIDGGLAAYNSGERRAALWLACNRDFRVLREETRNYIPSVLELLKRFESEAGLM
jgi:soluble lytic murein transglycosylase-like protein